MGLSHCPLCQGLALLCAVRCSAHLWMVWLRWGATLRPASTTVPATMICSPGASLA